MIKAGISIKITGAKLESRPCISEPKNLKAEVNGNILRQRYVINSYHANINANNDSVIVGNIDDANNDPVDAN